MVGPAKAWHNGNAQPLPRIVFELILEQPVHASWRLRKFCPTRNCAQPHHHKLSTVVPLDGSSMEPLPPRAFAAEISFDMDEFDVEGAIDTVLSRDDGRELDPASLHALYPVYSEEEFAAALAEIRAQRL